MNLVSRLRLEMPFGGPCLNSRTKLYGSTKIYMTRHYRLAHLVTSYAK